MPRAAEFINPLPWFLARLAVSFQIFGEPEDFGVQAHIPASANGSGRLDRVCVLKTGRAGPMRPRIHGHTCQWPLANCCARNLFQASSSKTSQLTRQACMAPTLRKWEDATNIYTLGSGQPLRCDVPQTITKHTKKPWQTLSAGFSQQE